MFNMDTATPESRKRFSSWLKQTINNGTCPGLEWVNRSQGIFKVPWYHFNKSLDIDKHFKVFKDWALYTGMHLSGGVEDFPKWKRNFRCAINKVSDIVEVPEMHSVKDSPSPYKVYRFLNAERLRSTNTSVPKSEEMWVFVEDEDATERSSPSLMSFVQVEDPNLVMLYTDNAGESKAPTTSSLSASSLSDVKLSDASSLPAYTPTISTVVMESLPFFEDVFGKEKEQKKQEPSIENQQVCTISMHAKRRLQKQQEQLNNSAENLCHVQFQTDEQFHAASNYCQLRDDELCATLSEGDSCEENITDEDAPMTLTRNDAILDLSTKSTASMSENSSPDLTNIKQEQTDESVKSMEDKRSIPSDLGLVNSDDMIGIPVPSPSSCQGREEDDNKTSQNSPLLQHRSSDSAETERITIKAFYGFHQQKVLDRKIKNGAKGCRVYFGEPVRDLPDLGEKMYGPKDALQVELPRADFCGNATPKQLDFIDAILREMHRGVVFSTSQEGDIYARRFCRTRAFVYDQDSQSWPLSRKINTPEKIFDFEGFKTKFETYKKKMYSGRQNSFPPVPYVYLTFGHRVPLENDIHGRVLVAMTIMHKGAEQMLRRFHASLGIGVASESGSRFLSSMDTMDKVIENYDCMSIE